jgi:hypothetical protein
LIREPGDVAGDQTCATYGDYTVSIFPGKAREHLVEARMWQTVPEAHLQRALT